jgi:glycosyltransferase involved in cell wall biosynthesis
MRNALNPPEAFPISCVIPTRDRPEALRRTLRSLSAQGELPAQLILIDASRDDASCKVADDLTDEFAARGCTIRWQSAVIAGAAPQRNQGMKLATQPVIAFFDDDIILQQDCLASLHGALMSDARIGGVNAMIANQHYFPPSWVSRFIFRLMRGRAEITYAGCLLGPAINILPEDREDLPEVVPVEWLNTTCTLYRREALPDPPFPDFFSGYSMMEDVALSVRVARDWKLANARRARIFHDSQPGAHKDDVAALSKMELVNRHYVMTYILEKRLLSDYSRLALWEGFQLLVCALQRRLGREFWSTLRGKWLGLRQIASGGGTNPF